MLLADIADYTIAKAVLYNGGDPSVPSHIVSHTHRPYALITGIFDKVEAMNYQSTDKVIYLANLPVNS